MSLTSTSPYPQVYQAWLCSKISAFCCHPIQRYATCYKFLRNVTYRTENKVFWLRIFEKGIVQMSVPTKV